jgi:hypothetical protein
VFGVGVLGDDVCRSKAKAGDAASHGARHRQDHTRQPNEALEHAEPRLLLQGCLFEHRRVARESKRGEIVVEDATCSRGVVNNTLFENAVALVLQNLISTFTFTLTSTPAQRALLPSPLESQHHPLRRYGSRQVSLSSRQFPIP